MRCAFRECFGDKVSDSGDNCFEEPQTSSKIWITVELIAFVTVLIVIVFIILYIYSTNVKPIQELAGTKSKMADQEQPGIHEICWP